MSARRLHGSRVVTFREQERYPNHHAVAASDVDFSFIENNSIETGSATASSSEPMEVATLPIPLSINHNPLHPQESFSTLKQAQASTQEQLWQTPPRPHLFSRRQGASFDVQLAVQSLYGDVVFVRGFVSFMYLLAYTTIAMVMLAAQQNIANSYDFDAYLRNTFILPTIGDTGLALPDIRTMDHVWAYLKLVWAPAMFAMRADNDVFVSDPLTTLPTIPSSGNSLWFNANISSRQLSNVTLYNCSVFNSTVINANISQSTLTNSLIANSSVSDSFLWSTNYINTVLTNTYSNGSQDITGPPLTNRTEFFVPPYLKVARTPYLMQVRQKMEDCSGWHTAMKCPSYTAFDSTNYGPPIQVNGSSYVPQFQFNSKKERYDVFFRISTDVPADATPATTFNTTNLAEALRTLDYLQQNNWLDSQTAFIRLQLYFYHPRFKMAAQMRIIFVQTHAGRLVGWANSKQNWGPQHLGSTIQIAQMSTTTTDWGRVVLEWIFVVMTAFWNILEIRKALRARKQASLAVFISPKTSAGRENLFNVLVLLLTYVSTVGYIYHFFSTRKMKKFDKPLMEDLETTSHTFYLLLGSVTFLFYVFRLLLATGFYARWRFLGTTLAYAFGELFHFSFLFILLMVGYAFTGVFYFGRDIYNYSDLGKGIQSILMQAIGMGRVDYEQMSAPGADISNGAFPLLFYWSFVFLVYFVLVNMFLAIVMGAYDRSKRDIEDSDKVYTRSIWNRIRRQFHFYFLHLFQDMHWVDQVFADYPVGLFSTFRLTGTQLKLVLKINLLAKSRVMEAQKLILVLPPGWVVGQYRTKAVWQTRKATALAALLAEDADEEAWEVRETACTCICAGGDGSSPVFELESDVISYDAAEWRTVVDIQLAAPQVQFLAGDVEICRTKAGHVAIAVGIDFDQCPFIIRTPELAIAQLADAPRALGRQVPKKMKWDHMMQYFENHFQRQHRHAPGSSRFSGE
eukprot:TRINITY_DN5414_c0_g1_i1.p1 TRINITY_DN5414_c0_g1~~TRINITY_DN5414_c0_g1_i1.p1  ORF type:complete len:967 (+),score=174.55 TRINITY_DN5414_c0_g1_i1:22-2922(+)